VWGIQEFYDFFLEVETDPENRPEFSLSIHFKGL
jgi:hypothetical protein